MNAKQRRIDRRRWKYDIDFTFAQVIERDYDLMWDWCVATFKNNGGKWREPFGPPGVKWQFTKPEYATLFALRWQ
jgi:hypothetical protein